MENTQPSALEDLSSLIEGLVRDHDFSFIPTERAYFSWIGTVDRIQSHHGESTYSRQDVVKLITAGAKITARFHLLLSSSQNMQWATNIEHHLADMEAKKAGLLLVLSLQYQSATSVADALLHPFSVERQRG